MKKIQIEKINETIYHETLSNGLNVYLYNKKDFHNNYVTFTTKFGSIYNNFTPINDEKSLKTPNGVAHFLEHKVFTQEKDPQPDDFFANNGASCNAYTTFKNTTYLFSGSDNLKENINYLLDFVQSPYFTDESVNSEKGIITQEINMCNDQPADILYETIRKNTLHNNPFKESIIGTREDINKINKELLLTCYNSFYHPANMFLVVTGNFNPEEIINSIDENQKAKNFSEFKTIEIPEYREPDEIVKEEETIYLKTSIPKVAYNIKINTDKLDMPKRKINLYLYIIFAIIFDDSSKIGEELKKQGIITNPISINLLNCDTHYILSLINETKEYQQLFAKIETTLQNIDIKEEELERKKKVLISNEIFSFENLEVINEMIIDNIIFEDKIETDPIGLTEVLSLEELNELLSKIDFKNVSKVIVKDEEK